MKVTIGDAERDRLLEMIGEFHALEPGAAQVLAAWKLVGALRYSLLFDSLDGELARVRAKLGELMKVAP